MLTPRFYLSQCYLVIKGVLWHSLESNFTRSAHESNPWHVFGDFTFKITNASPRGQWAKLFLLSRNKQLQHKCIFVTSQNISSHLGFRICIWQSNKLSQGHELTLILIWIWICNHMPSKVWGELTYPFNSYTVEAWEWRYNIIPHIIVGVTTYPCWDLSQSMLAK